MGSLKKSRSIYLIAKSFAHEEWADMRRHDVVKQQLVDDLDGLHLLLFCFETFVQQEIHTTSQLILRERAERKFPYRTNTKHDFCKQF